MFNIPKQPTMPIRSHHDLIVWQEAMELVRECYHLAERLPAMERFGIATQIRRSAVSVPANIAEGHGRRGRAEFLHHLSIAEGSLRELQTLLEAALATRLLEKDRPAILASGRLEPRKTIGSIDTSEFLVALAASIGFLLALSFAQIPWEIVGALLLGGIALMVGETTNVIVNVVVSQVIPIALVRFYVSRVERHGTAVVAGVIFQTIFVPGPGATPSSLFCMTRLASVVRVKVPSRVVGCFPAGS